MKSPWCLSEIQKNVGREKHALNKTSLHTALQKNESLRSAKTPFPFISFPCLVSSLFLFILRRRSYGSRARHKLAKNKDTIKWNELIVSLSKIMTLKTPWDYSEATSVAWTPKRTRGCDVSTHLIRPCDRKDNVEGEYCHSREGSGLSLSVPPCGRK